MSKRKLLQLVNEGHVGGWDDPRMPTLAGMRRRGYTPEAIRTFCERIGVGKRENLVDLALLEFCVREDLNYRAPRVMGVLNPLKVVLVNYPEGQVEELEAVNNPEDLSQGTRMVPFSRELYIEREDFMEDPPKKFYRLAPGREVRLRYAYFIKCEEVVKDPVSGEVVELRCTYDPATRGGYAPDGRQVKATLHWVSAAHAVAAEVRLYDRLFTQPVPGEEHGGDFKADLNPASLDGPDLLPPGAEPGQCSARELLPVRAPGLFLRGCKRQRPRGPGLQPDGDPERPLGQAPAGAEKIRGRRPAGKTRPEGTLHKLSGNDFSRTSQRVFKVPLS